MKKTIALAFAVPSTIAAIVAACTNLPELSTGYCGNSVIDPGEQCDNVGDDAGDAGYFSCYGPDAGAAACHYACNAGACPVGWGCGVDQVCRAPSGSFRLSAPFSADIRQLRLGDFDDDGRLDVVTHGAATTTVEFFDENGNVAATTSVSIPRGQLVVGDVTGSGTADLFALDSLIPEKVNGQPIEILGTGVDLFHAETRSFSTTLIPSIPIDPSVTDCRMVALNVGQAGTQAGGQDLVTVSIGPGPDGGSGALVAYVDPRTGIYPIGAVLPQIASGAFIGGDVPTGRLDESRPCDSLVVGLRGELTASAFTCTFVDGGAPPQTTVSFMNPIAGPMLLVDVNGDGHLDLVTGTNVRTDAGTLGEWVVETATGTGAGTFNATTTTYVRAGFQLLDAGGSGVGLIEGPLLGVGLIDGDNILDYVDSHGILLSTQKGVRVQSTGDVSLAKVVDLNGDGNLDVVALGTNGIDFWSGTHSTAMNHNFYAVPGASWFAVGDVDGDFVDDIVVTTSTITPAIVSVLYGQLGGYPQPPALVGNLTDIQHVTTGRLTWLFGDPPDTIQSPLVTAIDDTNKQISVVPIQGHGNRQLTSAFLLSPKPDAGVSFATIHNVPISGAIGNVPHGFAGAPTFDASLVLAAAANPDAGSNFSLQLWNAAPPVDASTILSTTTLIPPSLMNPTISVPQSVRSAAMIAVDWDETLAGDEIVLAMPMPQENPKATGGLLLLASDPAASVWRQINDPTTPFSGYTRLHSGTDLGVRLSKADFDSNERDDVLIVYGAQVVSTMPEQTSLVNAVVLLNDGNPKSFAWANAIALTALPPGTGGVAPVHAVAGAGALLAVATPNLVTLYQLDASAEGGLAIMNLTDAGPGIWTGIPDPVDLVSGDVNGDGVDDLVVAGPKQFVVLLGQAVIP